MTLLVSALMLPAVLYLLWRFLSVIRNNAHLHSRWWEAAVPLFLFSFYILPLSALIDWWISSDVELLTYPPPVMYWFWFGLVFCYHLSTWVIIVDLAKLISRMFPAYETVSTYHRWIVLGLFPIVLLFTGTKMYLDTTGIVVDERLVEVDDLPESMDGFRVVHISDIQGDEYTGPENIARYIEKVNEQEGDLVIFTGDLVSYGTEFIDMSAREFGKVKATHGVIAVVGDHDYWAGLEHIEPALAEENIPLLQNGNSVISIDATASLLVTGVVEVYSRRSDPEEMEEVMRQAGEHPVKILASHQIAPYLVDRAHKYGYRLFLAGHTHGGQIRVPFMGMSFSASERETDYVSGVYEVNDVLININNGLGFTLAPVRYNAKPNISVMELRRR